MARAITPILKVIHPGVQYPAHPFAGKVQLDLAAVPDGRAPHPLDEAGQCVLILIDVHAGRFKKVAHGLLHIYIYQKREISPVGIFISGLKIPRDVAAIKSLVPDAPGIPLEGTP